MKKRNGIAAILLALLISVMFVPAKAYAACTEHSLYQDEYALPTCTTAGYYILKCYNCDYFERVVTDKALGHSFDVVHTDPPTCTSNAINYLECTECSAQTTQEVPNSATGHSFGAWTVTMPASCSEEGIKVRECNCGYTERVAIPMTEHIFDGGTVVAAPTTSQEGIMLYICTGCEMQRTRPIPKITENVTPEPISTTSSSVSAASSSKSASDTSDASSKPESYDQPEEKTTESSEETMSKAPEETASQVDSSKRTDANAPKNGFPIWAIWLIAVGIAGVVAAVILIVILLKKRKQGGK